MAKKIAGYIKLQIPAGIARGESVRVSGEGLPKPRGGRGDLLVTGDAHLLALREAHPIETPAEFVRRL
jgi:DnaJ-class molecular chaperone